MSRELIKVCNVYISTYNNEGHLIVPSVSIFVFFMLKKTFLLTITKPYLEFPIAGYPRFVESLNIHFLNI